MPASGSLLDGLGGPDAAGLQEVEALITEEGLRLCGSDHDDSTDFAADSIQKYLNEISKIPLLSAADENALAERIRQGVLARSRLEENDLKGEEAEHLKKLAARGELAGRLLFQANLRLCGASGQTFPLVGNEHAGPDSGGKYRLAARRRKV